MNPSFLDVSFFGAQSTRCELFPRVLLVDDEPEILSATAQLLAWTGFTVTAVNSAEDAIVKLQIETFDLVVTDFRLGGKQGDAVVMAARNTCPATPVVLITGLVNDLPGWMTSEEFALPVVTKPFRIAELLSAAKRAVAETRAESVACG